MSAVADALEGRRTSIVERFTDRLYATSAASSLERSDVADSIDAFLLDLANEIRRDLAAPASELHGVPSAAEHGKQRFSLGYDLATTIREYGTLHELIFDDLAEHGVAMTRDEARAFTRHLIRGIAEAATSYATERDRELRKQTDRHVGFLAHELRNTLASVRLSVDLLRAEGVLPPGRRSATIINGLGRLQDQIDASLVEVRLASGEAVQHTAVDVALLLRDLADEAAPEAEARALTVIIEGEARVSADPRLLRSALSNLVRNAIKFSHHGGQVHLRARSADGRVVIEVEDACGGLPTGSVEKLFDPFVQAGKDRSGFGLGLAIAKQATEAHGGSIRVHDLPMKGCVFVVDLPERPSV